MLTLLIKAVIILIVVLSIIYLFGMGLIILYGRFIMNCRPTSGKLLRHLAYWWPLLLLSLLLSCKEDTGN